MPAHSHAGFCFDLLATSPNGAVDFISMCRAMFCHVITPVDGMRKVLFRRLLPLFAPSLFQKAEFMPPNLELYGDHRDLEMSNELNKKIPLPCKKKKMFKATQIK